MTPRLLVRTMAPLLLTLLSAAPAKAQSVWGRSSTFFRGFVRTNDRDVSSYYPFYEMVELHGRKLGMQGLSIDASLWALVDTVDIENGYRASGDVSTLYLSYRAPAEGKLGFLRGLELTGGRQLVALGPVILEQVDGGKVHYHHSSGLELGVFGGAPTGTRVAFQPWPLDLDRYNYGYNWLVGGRVGYLKLGHLAGGASFVHRRYRGRIADNDLGIDLSYAPHELFELSGSGTLSLEALRAREARGALRVLPIHGVDLELSYQYSSPDLWVPRSSIFSVFSEETFQEISLDVRWKATRSLTLDGGYGYRLYDAAADGRQGADGKNRASLRAEHRCGPERRRRTVVEAERVEAPENAYTRLRAATSIPLWLGKRVISTIIELDLMILDELFRGQRVSFTGGGYLQVPLTPRLSFLAGGNGRFSPLLEKAGSFLARLTWEFEAPTTQAVEVRRGGLQ